jgi:hypothetical protein
MTILGHVGAWVAIGAGIGTALYVATQEPFWIGVGVALGVAIGSSKATADKED